jgi:hypothetical protein
VEQRRRVMPGRRKMKGMGKDRDRKKVMKRNNGEK